MDAMGKNRPLYLQKHTTRHGQVAYYVRVKRGPLIRIRAEYGTEDFNQQYLAAVSGQPTPKAKANSASLQWLYDRYRESGKWAVLSKGTKRGRENIMLHVMKRAGHEPFRAIDSADIEAGKDFRRDTPAQARNYLDAMKGLFRWAKANGHVSVDPTAGVEAPKRLRGSSGFAAWDEADLAAYRKRWPLGTRERVWLEVLLGTGLRRGDAVRAGKMHLKDGVFSMPTEKTGMVMYCVIEAELEVALEAGPTGTFHFICGGRGAPLTKESFGNFFREACTEAGVKKSAHGVRKLAATIDAERGYSERELEAKYGWTGGFMASLYTKTANRRHMVIEAAKRSARVLPEMRGSYPAKSDSKSNTLEATKKPLVRSRKVP